ncbi:hypothetical protein BpHYR1_026680 [Brachionus plicatilis]|uniref:Uncharacterized protein n=1 Tax=Brachionus plicatilis TaxID=10195 RepID=A0A3M7Q2Y8_BRAPC|nr:hypothetical protein BpHYR1_026680 [Brachionus plicatilis]
MLVAFSHHVQLLIYNEQFVRFRAVYLTKKNIVWFETQATKPDLVLPSATWLLRSENKCKIKN